MKNFIVGEIKIFLSLSWAEKVIFLTSEGLLLAYLIVRLIG